MRAFFEAEGIPILGAIEGPGVLEMLGLEMDACAGLLVDVR